MHQPYLLASRHTNVLTDCYTPMIHTFGGIVFAIRMLGATLLMFAATAQADEPLAQRNSWDGSLAHFLHGTSLAADTDGDNKVDTLALPASFDVTAVDVPASATLVHAQLYWGGTQTQSRTTVCTVAGVGGDGVDRAVGVRDGEVGVRRG